MILSCPGQAPFNGNAPNRPLFEETLVELSKKKVVRVLAL